MTDREGAAAAGPPAGSSRVGLLADAALMAAVIAGDGQAFAELHHRYRRDVQLTAQRVIVDGWMAQDIAQEVFLEVWGKAGRFDPRRGTVRGWILGLARSRAIDRVRASESLKRHDRYWAAGQVARDSDTVTEAVLDRLDHHRVRSTLDSLSVVQRQAIELCYFARHTFVDAAVLLDIPLPTFKSRVRDALIKLRTEMAD